LTENLLGVMLKTLHLTSKKHAGFQEGTATCPALDLDEACRLPRKNGDLSYQVS